jgi:hypothetical protein
MSRRYAIGDEAKTKKKIMDNYLSENRSLDKLLKLS